MKECPFEIGDQIYNIKNDKVYNVTHISGNMGIICEIIIISNQQAKWYQPIIEYDEWKEFVLLKNVRKIKLQKINANKTF